VATVAQPESFNAGKSQHTLGYKASLLVGMRNFPMRLSRYGMNQSFACPTNQHVRREIQRVWHAQVGKQLFDPLSRSLELFNVLLQRFDKISLVVAILYLDPDRGWTRDPPPKTVFAYFFAVGGSRPLRRRYMAAAL
jgi:hypothetical protein